MCWQNSFIDGVETFCPHSTAPTFSWCSVNGLRDIHRWVHYDKVTTDAVVVDFDTELRHAGSPFGDLVDKRMVLRRRHAPASHEYIDNEYHIMIVLDESTSDHDSTTGEEDLKFCPDTHIPAAAVKTSLPEDHQDRVLWTGTRVPKAPNGVNAAPPEVGGCVVWMLLIGTVIRSCDKVEVAMHSRDRKIVSKTWCV